MNFFEICCLNTFSQLAIRKYIISAFLSVVAMVAYMTHVRDELIGSPSARRDLSSPYPLHLQNHCFANGRTDHDE